MNSRLLIAALFATCPSLPAPGADPYARQDNSWIGISGVVTSVAPQSFNLDYGKGIIIVELDDWDFDADGYKFLPGDEVTVRGLVDDDLFETTTIEAASVYVKGLNTYFYGSATNEESLPAAAAVTRIDHDIEISGNVSEINGREFSIDTGTRRIRIDTRKLSYNPLDDEGYQQIEVGDRVSVTGNMDVDWWEKRELVARSVTTLEDRS